MAVLIALAAVIGMALSVGVMTVYEVTAHRLRAVRDAETLAELVRASVASAIQSNDTAAAIRALTPLSRREEVGTVGVYHPDGREFARYRRPGGPASLPFPSSVVGRAFYPDRAIVTVPLGVDGRRVGWLRLHYAFPSFVEQLPRYGIAVLIDLLVLGAAALLLLTMLGRSVTQPLLALADAARHLASTNDLKFRVPRQAADEIGQLTAAFNTMLDSVQERELALERAAMDLSGSETRLRLALSAATMQSWMLSANAPEIAEFLAGVHAEDRAAVERAITRALARRAAFEVEFRSADPAGRERLLALRGHASPSEDGSPAQLIGVIHDITERRGLEHQLMQAQKMEAIGNLAGGIAHDFNNLLTGMIGHLQFAQRALPPGSQVRADVDEVERAARRAAELTSQLLAYARRQMITPTIVDLNGSVRAVETMLRRLLSENVVITTDLDPSLWPTRVDAGQFEQVLMNLAVNARDAMSDGGRLSITTRNVREDVPGGDLAAPEVGDFAEVIISDTGAGMSAATLERIFDPFFTTKPVGQGTGLGLAMCYGIVKQAEGQIVVESELDAGTTFRIRFPRVGDSPAAEPEWPAEPAEPAEPAGPVETAGGRETILIAEDDDALRGLAARTLREAGYNVLEAADGQAAHELAMQQGNAVDLLLTDVVMPGQNGRELAADLRRTWPSLPVLFMSGYSDTIVEGGDGGDVLLAKPFTPDELRRATRRVLDVRRPAPA